MQTPACRSSNGLSRGPKVHSTSITDQPSPAARARICVPPDTPSLSRRASTASRSTAIFPKMSPRRVRMLVLSQRRQARRHAFTALFNQVQHTEQPAMNALDHGPAAGFHAALAAPGRAADIDDADDLYGWLIGSWDMDVLHYRVDVRERHLT